MLSTLALFLLAQAADPQPEQSTEPPAQAPEAPATKDVSLVEGDPPRERVRIAAAECDGKEDVGRPLSFDGKHFVCATDGKQFGWAPQAPPVPSSVSPSAELRTHWFLQTALGGALVWVVLSGISRLLRGFRIVRAPRPE